MAAATLLPESWLPMSEASLTSACVMCAASSAYFSRLSQFATIYARTSPPMTIPQNTKTMARSH